MTNPKQVSPTVVNPPIKPMATRPVGAKSTAGALVVSGIIVLALWNSSSQSKKPSVPAAKSQSSYMEDLRQRTAALKAHTAETEAATMANHHEHQITQQIQDDNRRQRQWQQELDYRANRDR